MTSRFTHLALELSDEDKEEAGATSDQTSAPVQLAENERQEEQLIATPRDAVVSKTDSPRDELNATVERIIPSGAGSPDGVRVAQPDEQEAPPSSAFIDCVSAGATFSQFTPQRSVAEQQAFLDLVSSPQSVPPPPVPQPDVAESQQAPAAASSAALPVVTEYPQVEVGRPALLSPAQGESPAPVMPSDQGPSASPVAEDKRPDTPEESKPSPWSISDLPVVRPDDATSASNPDSTSITSGKGVLRSLYLDQQRRQQRHAQTAQSQTAQQPAYTGVGVSGVAHPSRGSSLTTHSDSPREPSQRSTDSATPRNRQRRSDSAEWADSQQRALAQLRAELESTIQTPFRHGGGHLTPQRATRDATSRAPLVAIEHSRVAAAPTMRAGLPSAPANGASSSPPGKDHTMLTVRPNLSTISQISPLRNEVPSVLADLYGQSPYSQAPGDLVGLSPFHEDDRDELYRAQQQQAYTRSQQKAHTSPSHAASQQVAGSPDTPGADDTPVRWMPRRGNTHSPPRAESTSRKPSPARSPLPQTQSQTDTRGETGVPAAGRVRVSGNRIEHRTNKESLFQNTTTASGHRIPAVNLDARERKLQRLRSEAEAKEMADCTFHPVISPGTRAMVELSRLAEAPHAADEVPVDASAAAAAALTDPVFDRLYPEKLVVAASQKRQMEAEMEARTLSRAEMLALRRRCRAPFKVETPEASFDVFLSNVLGRDCYEEGALVMSTYKSPMAVALIEEKAARRRLAARRRNELREDVEDSQEFRIALFDEFLLRQNAHYFNKARAIQQLEHRLTPSFKPETTETSTRIVKRLVERSLLDETIDPEEKAQLKQRQARGVPIASALVRKHKSKYDDPCTFRPAISPYAARSPANKSTASATARPKTDVPRYETLYQEHKRLAASRAAEMAKAAEAEVKDCTFCPTNLNRKQNARVTSFVEEPSYTRHEAQKRERQQRQAALRAEQALLEEARENRECTFRPRVTKPPAYISRMAKSFGVIRTQDTQF